MNKHMQQRNVNKHSHITKYMNTLKHEYMYPEVHTCYQHNTYKVRSTCIHIHTHIYIYRCIDSSYKKWFGGNKWAAIWSHHGSVCLRLGLSACAFAQRPANSWLACDMLSLRFALLVSFFFFIILRLATFLFCSLSFSECSVLFDLG